MKLTTISCKIPNMSGGEKISAGPFKRWSTFGLCLFILWLFIFVIAPHYEKSEYVKPLANFIQESGIDSGAIYYTEVEEVSDADLMIRDTFRFYLDEKE